MGYLKNTNIQQLNKEACVSCGATIEKVAYLKLHRDKLMCCECIGDSENMDNCVKCDEVVSYDRLNKEQICENCVEDGPISEDERKYL